jgi:hypothetical protein
MYLSCQRLSGFFWATRFPNGFPQNAGKTPMKIPLKLLLNPTGFPRKTNENPAGAISHGDSTGFSKTEAITKTNGE